MNKILNLIGRRKSEAEMRASSLYARDIAEKKSAEEELLKSKKLLDETNRLAKVGGWEIDLKANTLFWSEMTYKIHEVAPDFIPNLETAINFYAPEAVPVISGCIDRAIKFGEPFDAELELITAKKNRLWVRAVGEAYRENGEIVKIGGVFQDINERKLVEGELNKYRLHLEDMVKQRTSDLSNVLMEVRETVNILAASSAQILAATTQVASGTAETATAISETTATVEEVQHAVKLNAEKAKNVANNAQRMAQVSQNGQKAVEEALAGMNQIRIQMDSIGQTVIRLSEQSQSIGGIIASVTEIADQSNLLSVNAAIEAAKAGEHGKGFAVVAQEIKNLASQSKQATLQVRNILFDVQKATSAAVLASEQGSKAVETCLKQSAQAGEAIRILSESSNEAVNASAQIVASSQQQVVGMDQISVAMQNINQAGTENAVSMVQSEKSAKNLHELGQKLKEVVDKFKE